MKLLPPLRLWTIASGVVFEEVTSRDAWNCGGTSNVSCIRVEIAEALQLDGTTARKTGNEL